MKRCILLLGGNPPCEIPPCSPVVVGAAAAAEADDAAGVDGVRSTLEGGEANHGDDVEGAPVPPRGDADAAEGENHDVNAEAQSKYVTARAFYAYNLHIRPNASITFKMGRLFEVWSHLTRALRLLIFFWCIYIHEAICAPC